MSYFEDGDTVPPPFNMIPTAKTFDRLVKCGKSGKPTKSIIVSVENFLKNLFLSVLFDFFCFAEKITRESVGKTRHGDAPVDQTLRDRRAK